MGFLALSGCHSDSSASLTHDSAQVSPSAHGKLAVVTGSSQHLSITFAADDGRPLSKLLVTGGLMPLPPGWSGPEAFSCATVTTGNACVLNLVYSPTTGAAGTLTLGFIYFDNAGALQTNSISIPYAATTNDNVAGTVAPSDQISAVAGTGSQSVLVTFTTDDGNGAANLTVTAGLASLPAGWSSASSSFACATLSTGNGCQLALSYAPSAAGSGTIALNYGYLDNSGNAKTGSVSFAYAATTHDNVVGTASPSGQVNATVGTGTQSVFVTFTTDDGNAATNLTVTDGLTSLPAGWSSPSGSFACAAISTGNGCQLALSYAPSAPGSGTITLSYAYHDDSGTPKTGNVSLAYAATTHDNVVATASPSGQINAIVGTGTQTVSVTFDTDDGQAASALTLSVGTLPAGWSSSTGSLTCNLVSTGNGCQLSLSYAPSTAGSGTLTLNYAYTDNSGSPRTGSLNVSYAATTHDNLVGTASPSGQVNAVVGAGTQPVTVTFTTDDGQPASAFTLTTNLSSLPAGWSSTSSSLTCSTVSTGNGCQLPLSYAPGVAGSGTLTLDYSYTDDSGTATTGLVHIPYAATTHNSIVGTAAPSGQIVATPGGAIAPVTVTFTTDDGNQATALAMTTDLTSLPAGWSSTPSSFSCGTVSTGTACQLALSYAPTVVGSGTLDLNFGYDDDSGAAKTGTVSISYATPSPHLYVTQLIDPYVESCTFNSDGTLGSCSQTATSGSQSTTGIVFHGDTAYVTDFYNGKVYLCHANGTGPLSACVDSGASFFYPWALTISGNWLYVTSANTFGNVTYCAIAADGSLSNCTATASGITIASGIAADSTHAYITAGSGSLARIDVCSLGIDGSLSSCASTGSGFSGPSFITLSGGYAYVSNESGGSVSACAINGTDGTFSSCTHYAIGSSSAPNSLAISGTQAYVSDNYGHIYLCTVDGSTGALSGCAISDGGTSFYLPQQIAIR